MRGNTFENKVCTHDAWDSTHVRELVSASAISLLVIGGVQGCTRNFVPPDCESNNFLPFLKLVMLVSDLHDSTKLRYLYRVVFL